MDAIPTLPSYFRISVEQLEKITPLLFEKDYSSVALSFLDNPARMLHYWSEEPNILPVGDDGGKRRRYSFFDMIWLMLISELRDFGMEKQVLAVLKEELLTKLDTDVVRKEMQKDPVMIKQMMRDHFKMTQQEVEDTFFFFQEKKAEIEQLQATQLYSHVMYSLIQQKVVRLLINKKGNHFLYVETDVGGIHNSEEHHKELGDCYLTVNLSNIITNLLSLPQIKDQFKEAFFTAQEWKLLQFLQKEKPQSIKITYKGEQMDLLELTHKKKIKAEARLSEILLKDAYETVEIESVKGNIINCTITEKHKL